MVELWNAPEFLIGCLLFLGILSFSPFGLFFFCSSSLVALLWTLTSHHGIHPGAFSFFDLSLTTYRQLFAVLVTSVGGIVGIYSHFYISEERKKFFGLMALFQTACFLAVIADHGLFLFTAWELTSLTSFFLIGLKGTPESKRNAWQALFVTALGGAFLFAAIVLLGKSYHTYSLQLLTEASSQPLLAVDRVIFICLLIAAMAKSAQWPLHFWLPSAMVAPTPISAYLHSASLVNLGVFLIGLFWMHFKHDFIWHVLLCTVGLISFSYGAVRAFFSEHTKCALAFSTFSQLGLILMLFGLANAKAYAAAILLLIAHALYKSFLFLSIGMREKFSSMAALPWSLMIAAVLSAIGLPAFFGFYGKELVLEFVFGPFPAQNAKYFTWITATIGFVFQTAFLFLLMTKHSFGNDGIRFQKTSASYRTLLLSAAPLSIFGFILGVLPFPVFHALKKIIPDFEWQSPESLSGGVIGGIAYLTVGLLLGAYEYRTNFFRSSIARFRKRFSFIFGAISNALYFVGITIASFLKIIFVSHESLLKKTSYGILFLGAACIWYAADPSFVLPDLSVFHWKHLIFSLTLLSLGSAAFGLCFLNPIPLQIIALGCIGYIVAFAYAVFGAPDLVLTQILIETVSVILLMLGWLIHSRQTPSSEHVSGRVFGRVSLKIARLKSLLVWAFSGTIAFVLLAGFQLSPWTLGPKLSSLYFYENAVKAGGINLVNLVIVDFRGLDTLGEITVFAAAYFAVTVLVKRLKISESRSSALFSDSRWLQKLSPLLSAVLTLAALWLFFRGHNAPGGGFIGGLLMALALFLLRCTSEKKLPHLWMTAGGLLIAYVTSILPMMNGVFFQSFQWPAIGPTSLFFDAGVFFTVTGALCGLFDYFSRLYLLNIGAPQK